MRVIVQRVEYGKCTVDGNITGEINDGLLLLVGLTEDDKTDSSTNEDKEKNYMELEKLKDLIATTIKELDEAVVEAPEPVEEEEEVEAIVEEEVEKETEVEVEEVIEEAEKEKDAEDEEVLEKSTETNQRTNHR